MLRRAEAWGHLPAEGWGRIPVAPLTEEYGDPDLAGAFAVQEADVRIRLAAGEHPLGRKAGLTPVPMCEQLGLPEASFGTLCQSIPDGGTTNTRELITPRAEAEVGLILGRLSGPRVRARRSGRSSPSRRRPWRSSTAPSPTSASPRPTPSPATPPRRASPSAVPSTPRTSCSWGSGTSTSGSTPTGSVAPGLGAEVLGDPLRAVARPARTLHAQGSALHPGELLLHRVRARRRPTDTGLSARRALRHRPPARTDRHRPMNHQQGSGGAAMPPREPERSGSSGVHLNARRTTSPRGRRSARPIRPEEAQR
ncbi:2-keto-4-pentenoate hydratase [Streptomyces sp. TLI_55]|nr:2-keto-4-pentenoate hydratase [Streptomyces sp. TLI_55]